MNESHDQWHGLDLNLLVAFDALARERSVTRAAKEAGVTQSAMSHTLRRLRTLFDDPLLVRSGQGMLLTPRAEGLIVPIRSGLVALHHAVFRPPRFDPLTAERTFTLTTPDLVDVLLLPGLIERLRLEGPRIDLTVLPLHNDGLATDLSSGEIDLAIVPVLSEDGDIVPTQSSPGLVRKTLLRDGFSGLCRPDHPALVDGAMSLDAFLQADHALIAPRGRGKGVVDQALAARGLSRRIALRVPGFTTAPAIVASTDLLLTAPTALAHIVVHQFDLVMFDPPVEIPSHGVGMLWHERFTRDPAHRWFRQLLENQALHTAKSTSRRKRR